MRPSSDRISALRRMPVPDLAALLGRLPALALSLAASPALPPVGTDLTAYPRASDGSLTHLAVLLASPRGVGMAIQSLNVIELQLLLLAGLHDGAIERPVAVQEAGEDRALDQAVGALANLLLAYPAREEGEWLALRPGVLRYIPFEGVRIYDALHSLPGSDLDVLMDRLGEDQPPYLHEDRRRRVGALFRDPVVSGGVRENLDPEAQRMLDLLVVHGAQRIADLGLPPFDPWDRRGGPLHQLVQSALVGVDTAAQQAFVWLDVAYGLRGRLFDDWPMRPPAIPAQPLHDEGSRTPRVIRRLLMLLDLWGTETVPALANGGIGVRSVRAAAKGFGVDAGDIGLLAHLAIDMGLLGETDDGAWAPTPELAEFTAMGPARQWVAIVAAWQQATTVDEAAGLPTRWTGEMVWPARGESRRALLEVLHTLDAGTGVDQDTFVGLCTWRYPTNLDPTGAVAMVHVLRLLDLVPPTGAIGLTSAARALLDHGLDGAVGALGPIDDKVVVQADHTVIAPPGLSPRVAGELSAMAVLESDAGAQIWRITPARIGQALADGRTREGIAAFLHEVSRVTPPSNVLVTIDDVAARHGRLRAGTIGSYLRCQDPMDLAGAAAVSAAKLRILAPTVAVSPLTRDALVKALRGRDLLAVAEDADGLVIPPRRASGTALADTGLLPDIDVVRVDSLALAEQMWAAEEPAT